MQQVHRDFAHTLDATTALLGATGLRIHKHRDVIDALQGIGGGRVEFDCSHTTLARRMDHSGQKHAAETYVSRKLDALIREQRRVGKEFFTIVRGGGIEHRRTHYIDNLTPVAVAVMRRARASATWKQNPGAALMEQAVLALDEIPDSPRDEKTERDPLPMDNDELIQRNCALSVNAFERALELVAANHGNIDTLARLHLERLTKRVYDFKRRHESGEVVDSKGTPTRMYPQPKSQEIGPPPQKCDPRKSEDEDVESQDAALIYAAKGWSVIPLFSVSETGVCSCAKGRSCMSPGKHPRTLHGVRDATTDGVRINGYWNRFRSDGVGIATGAISGIDVLDVDPRNGGDQTLRILIEQFNSLPETIAVATGGGGFHLYFRHAGIKLKGSLGPGLDIKSTGGFVVAPPTLHVTGQRYKWLKAKPLSPWPEWMLERLEMAAAETPITVGVEVDMISEGRRNAELFRLAAAERGRGASYIQLLQKLREVNSVRVRPPVEDVELLKIASSAARYPTNAEKAGRI